MARFFSTTASSASKRSLAFIGRTASRLINTIQSAVHRPEHQQVLSETVDGESTPPQIQTTPDVDTETVAATDEGGETSSEESEVLDIVTSEDSDDTEDESTAANPDQNAIPTHAPFRAPREFLLPRAPTPRAAPSEDSAPELSQALSSDRPDRTFLGNATRTVPTLAARCGTKRARAPEDDGSSEDSESEAGPSTPPTRRPHVRPRLSIPHPRCRRDRCIARHIHTLDRFPSERRAASDDEGAWSTTPQAADSGSEHETPVQEETAARQNPTTSHNPQRRSRDARDDDAENGTPAKRTRR
ncbi:hypothetical protein C8Q70DRAFT_979995 [Cubamyces menziesii]|uniref:Uncharacterized protein n=1 Tax=Trametes cubensis TaxID=1111947 RepID=A0AAD7U3G7_9APHY|nr:hypothetical protein C8Q70DRAFT_979995 [Cubamyces menziesii]KAJ8501806.1 hypothetical protein ONZ51_g384 [Trametes cubensis]